MRAVTMRLGDEIFAVEAERVREILEIGTVTSVPNAPDFVGGLINVRGTVVPLADLRVSFGMPRPPHDEDTRIVVMEIEIDGEKTVAGVLADKVHDVTDLDAESMEPAPRIGMRWPQGFVRGIAKRDGRFIIIPDINRIFAHGVAADH
ncbi:MAG: chemotaxis protein CheW [Methylobacterium mesophilicum]|nr:chemotaxis protein CheW [Methylobacterium mesophilicum]